MMGEQYSMCLNCGIKKGRHTHPTFIDDVLCDDCAPQEYELEIERVQGQLDEINGDIQRRSKPCLNS